METGKKRNFGVNIILTSGFVTLLIASLFYDKDSLTRWISLWISISAVIIAFRILFSCLEIFITRQIKITSTIKEAAITIGIIILGDILLFRDNIKLWEIAGKYTIIITSVLVILVFLYLTVFSKTNDKK